MNKEYVHKKVGIQWYTNTIALALIFDQIVKELLVFYYLGKYILYISEDVLIIFLDCIFLIHGQGNYTCKWPYKTITGKFCYFSGNF